MAEPKETVPFYDVSTQRVVRIPPSELAPGAAQARVEGIDEIVWVMANELKQGPIQHPPFDERTMAAIEEIRQTFMEHYPQSLKEWEEGFRRDGHPMNEIALWLHAVKVYKEFASKEPVSVKRKDIFQLVATCLSVSPDGIWNVFQPKAITRDEASKIISRFFAQKGG